MKIVAFTESSSYRKVMLVEMTDDEFARCAGVRYADKLPHGSLSVGTTLDVSGVFNRVEHLGTASTKQTADQLVALAALLRPLEGVLVECRTIPPPPTKPVDSIA